MRALLALCAAALLLATSPSPSNSGAIGHPASPPLPDRKPCVMVSEQDFVAVLGRAYHQLSPAAVDRLLAVIVAEGVAVVPVDSGWAAIRDDQAMVVFFHRGCMVGHAEPPASLLVEIVDGRSLGT